MQHREIVTRLSVVDPTEIIYSISMQSVLSEIANRCGEEALTLSLKDLYLARDEVKIAIDHHLDPREYIDMGLDAWEIVRNL